MAETRPEARLPLEYVLPIRRSDRGGEAALLRYLAWLVERVDVTVVDGSDPVLFEALGAGLPAGVRHLPPAVGGLNGKARGALTGIRAARHEVVVIADDDVRYGERSLAAVGDQIAEADFLRLQNVYTAHPWYVCWDTARMLVGRAFGGDFGGTVALRRSPVERAGGYSTDVLFENLELERTVRFAGGRVVVARDVLVPRVPPTFQHFLRQRVRQAYDDFAQPGRLAVELMLLPVVIAAVIAGAWRIVWMMVLGAMVIAETGRRRGRTRTAVSAAMALWAPAWAAERAVAVWIALIQRARGGVGYAGSRIHSAGTPVRLLRARLSPRGVNP